jgi:hypothetical protein
MVRVDQWVRWAGFSWVVFSITRFTWAAEMLGVRPGRGASFFQSRHSQSEKSVPPTRDFLRADSQVDRNLLILFSRSRQQHDAGAFHQTDGEGSCSRTLFQRFSLFRSQLDWGSNTHRKNLSIVETFFLG